MSNSNNSLDQHVFKKLRRSNIIALVVIAVSVIVSHIIIRNYDELNKLPKLELLLTVLFLLILIGVFFFLLMPSEKLVKIQLSDLLESEKKAKKMAYDADILSETKEKSIKELRALSHVMDQTLLFARITSDGTIVHMGNKFSQLFKFSKFGDQNRFSEVLSFKESQQLVVEDLISKHKKTGWQGEVKATTKHDIEVWLEMSIIPFNPSDDKSELLIIASDITKRKAGQLEIERLTKDSFE